MENFNVNNSSAYKLFGFELRDYSSGNTITSDKIPDFVQYHVDLVVLNFLLKIQSQLFITIIHLKEYLCQRQVI